MEKVTGVCPRCLGTKRRPWAGDHKYAGITAGYDADTDTLPCNNCGGQTMSMQATGRAPLRPDGTACLHEYQGRTTSNCYHEYTCKHCGHRYDIDSGD